MLYYYYLRCATGQCTSEAERVYCNTECDTLIHPYHLLESITRIIPLILPDLHETSIGKSLR
jgi:hypothetical protein